MKQLVGTEWQVGVKALEWLAAYRKGVMPRSRIQRSLILNSRELRTSPRFRTMKPSERIVTEIPVSEIWNSEGALEAHRVGLLRREDVRRLVQQGVVRFAVADVGCPLRWISAEDRYVFWKEERKPHIVDQPDRPIDVYGYPHGYAYVASEWHLSDALASSIVLLEKYH